jgi:hypothetical protein
LPAGVASFRRSRGTSGAGSLWLHGRPAGGSSARRLHGQRGDLQPTEASRRGVHGGGARRGCLRGSAATPLSLSVPHSFPCLVRSPREIQNGGATKLTKPRAARADGELGGARRSRQSRGRPARRSRRIRGRPAWTASSEVPGGADEAESALRQKIVANRWWNASSGALLWRHGELLVTRRFRRQGARSVVGPDEGDSARTESASCGGLL